MGSRRDLDEFFQEEAENEEAEYARIALLYQQYVVVDYLWNNDSWGSPQVAFEAMIHTVSGRSSENALDRFHGRDDMDHPIDDEWITYEIIENPPAFLRVKGEDLPVVVWGKPSDAEEVHPHKCPCSVCAEFEECRCEDCVS